MPKKVLLVIDMLNDFMAEDGSLFCGQEARAIIPFINDRILEYRQEENPIVFITDAHDPDDPEFKRYPPHAVEGTWGNEIIPELAPAKGDKIIAKKTLSSFYKTDLDQVIENFQPETVEVVGVCTSICIMDAVGELTNRGFYTIVPVKGVADFDPEAHGFALKRMQTVYGAKVS